MKVFFTLFATAFVVGIKASNVLDLNPGTFDDVVGVGKPGLVELYVSSTFNVKGI